MKHKTLVLLILGSVLLPGLAQLRPTGEPERSFTKLQWRLRDLILEFNQGRPPSAALLHEDLDNFYRALAEASDSRVDRRGANSLEVPVKNTALFGKRPTLPSEVKNEGVWSFVPVVLEARARHLYIYGLRFEASRTMRIKQVALTFRDGSEVVHDRWSDLNDGNGKVFERHVSTPMLPAWYPGAPREARAIDRVTILGSAQDGNFEATLAFFFEIPDPNDPPFRELFGQLESLREDWATRSMDQQGLNRCRQELSRLADELGVPFCIDISAR